MEKTLNSLVKAYQMPDDRVFIKENAMLDTGHTHHSEIVGLSVQSENARPVCIIQAPQGLPIEAKRTLMRDLSSRQSLDFRDITSKFISNKEW